MIVLNSEWAGQASLNKASPRGVTLLGEFSIINFKLCKNGEFFNGISLGVQMQDNGRDCLREEECRPILQGYPPRDEGACKDAKITTDSKLSLLQGSQEEEGNPCGVIAGFIFVFILSGVIAYHTPIDW